MTTEDIAKLVVIAFLALFFMAYLPLVYGWPSKASRRASERRPGVKDYCCNKREGETMPTVTSRVNGGATPALAGYPKFMQGRQSGSVYLLSAPNTGTIVHLGGRPYVGPKAARKGNVSKHKLGYYSTRLREQDMAPFTGEVTLAGRA